MYSICYKILLLFIFSTLKNIYPSQDNRIELKVIRRASLENIKNLSPYKVTSYAERDILTDIFEGLVTYSYNCEVVPAAAKYWYSNDTGTVWNFILRDDIFWSDGTPVVAEDFARGWKVLVDGKQVGKLTECRRRSFLEYRVPIKNALYRDHIAKESINENEKSEEDFKSLDTNNLGLVSTNETIKNDLGIEVINDKELKLTLEFGVKEEVLLEYLCDLFFFPIKEDYLDKLDNWLDLPMLEQMQIHMPTNGVYTLKYFQRGQNICLVKNNHYRDKDKIFYDEVFYLLNQTSEKVRLRFINNEIDIFASSILKEDVFISFLDYMKYIPQSGVSALIFNLEDKFLQELKIRQAINYLVDKDHLFKNYVKKVYINDCISPNFHDDRIQISLEERMQSAESLLKDLGYTEENPLTLNLYPQYVDDEILNIMNHLLNSIPNLKVNFMFMERSALSEKLAQRDFQLYFTMFRPNASWNTIDYFSWGYSNGSQRSISSYNNAEFLSILESLVKENGSLSKVEFASKINRLEEITNQDRPYIQIGIITAPYVVRDGIKGVSELPMYPHGTIPSALLYE